jgi:hypothetical protein
MIVLDSLSAAATLSIFLQSTMRPAKTAVHTNLVLYLGTSLHWIITRSPKLPELPSRLGLQLAVRDVIEVLEKPVAELVSVWQDAIEAAQQDAPVLENVVQVPVAHSRGLESRFEAAPATAAATGFVEEHHVVAQRNIEVDQRSLCDQHLHGIVLQYSRISMHVTLDAMQCSATGDVAAQERPLAAIARTSNICT